MQALAVLFRVATNDGGRDTTCLLVGMAIIVVRQYWTVRMGMRGLIMTDMLQGTVAYLVAGLVCIIILAAARAPSAPYSSLAHLPSPASGAGRRHGSLRSALHVLLGLHGHHRRPLPGR